MSAKGSCYSICNQALKRPYKALKFTAVSTPSAPSAPAPCPSLFLVCKHVCTLGWHFRVLSDALYAMCACCSFELLSGTRLGQGAKFFRAEDLRDNHGHLLPAPGIVLAPGPASNSTGLKAISSKVLSVQVRCQEVDVQFMLSFASAHQQMSLRTGSHAAPHAVAQRCTIACF